MEIPALMEYGLAGGTALALHYGHRKSIDLDLFSIGAYHPHLVTTALEEKFTTHFNYREDLLSIGIFSYIHEIKVDIIKYDHPVLAPLDSLKHIRIFSLKDLSAMKIQAILGRGTKKDFWDICELLNHFSIDQLIQFHQAKFPNQRLLISVPNAFVYFDDADSTPDPVSLNGLSWSDVKSRISEAVRTYLN